MQKRENRVLESYRRVTAFLANYPAPDPQTYAEARSILEQVLGELETHTRAQVLGKNLSRKNRTEVETALRRLRRRHLLPIVAVARAHRNLMPGIDRALRMPGSALSVSAQLREAEGIRSVAARFEPVFRKFGQPDGFLEQLSTAIAAVEEAVASQVFNLRQKVAARKDIEKSLRKGRDAVDMLDPIVRVLYEGNEGAIRAWENARRVRALPGPSDAEVGQSPVPPSIAA